VSQERYQYDTSADGEDGAEFHRRGKREAMNAEREMKMNQFIGGLVACGDISSDTACCALAVWEQIKGSIGDALLVPDASAGPDGTFMFFWNRDEHHLEIEFIATEKQIELFYMNHITNQLWGADYITGEPRPEQFLEKLSLFTEANL
jgi:hypothetical protein